MKDGNGGIHRSGEGRRRPGGIQRGIIDGLSGLGVRGAGRVGRKVVGEACWREIGSWTAHSGLIWSAARHETLGSDGRLASRRVCGDVATGVSDDGLEGEDGPVNSSDSTSDGWNGLGR